MTYPRLENDPEPPRRENPFEGMRVDLPFGSFQVGAVGRATRPPSDDVEYERARARVQARLAFFRHLTTYAAVVAAIVFIDLVTGGGMSAFVLWIAGVWGALLVWQAFNVFVFPVVWNEEAEERMIQNELKKHRDS